MTRKRYVKLLMGAGIDRNTANRTAAFLRPIGWGYQKFYDKIMTPVIERYA